MMTSGSFPGPRDSLDEGSLADLARDSREMGRNIAEFDLAECTPRLVSHCVPSEVPDDACALVEGFAAYGC